MLGFEDRNLAGAPESAPTGSPASRYSHYPATIGPPPMAWPYQINQESRSDVFGSALSFAPASEGRKSTNSALTPSAWPSHGTNGAFVLPALRLKNWPCLGGISQESRADVFGPAFGPTA